MKKVLFFLFLAGIAGLALYYIKPEIIKSVSDRLNAVQLPLPDVAGDMSSPTGGKAPAEAKSLKPSSIKCPHCKNGKMRCSGCSGTGIPNHIICYNCGRAAVSKHELRSDSILVYCPHCKLTLGRRADLKCKYCGGTGIMDCPYCKGTGFIAGNVVPVNTVPCTVCNRTGTVDCPKTVTMRRQFISPANNGGKGARAREGSADDMITVTCPVCRGTGRKKCPECGGKCYIVLKAEKTVTVEREGK